MNIQWACANSKQTDGMIIHGTVMNQNRGIYIVLTRIKQIYQDVKYYKLASNSARWRYESKMESTKH